jgi:hypothetical protein
MTDWSWTRAKGKSYFVWRPDESSPYRAYGTANHFMPPDNDLNCIWRGDDYIEARRVAREANNSRGRKRDVLAAKSGQGRLPL